MQQINTLRYGPFTTEVFVRDNVNEFLQEGDEVVDLTDFDQDEWYQSWLLKHLDKDKDGVPDLRFGKDFKLIYSNLIQNPEDYMDVEDILEELGLSEDDLIFDGSKTIFKDVLTDAQKTKFWVRWIVVKKR
ncbi:hypothetical protein HOE04_00010 [archaeon]|jgi:hypothetical protein|nr:hypothetical protein [archaeon]